MLQEKERNYKIKLEVLEQFIFRANEKFSEDNIQNGTKCESE